MTGPFLALLAALFFAWHALLVRRAVLGVQDAAIGIIISVPAPLPFLFAIFILTGRVQQLVAFSWQSYIWLSMAGIFFFVVGRALIYKCIQLVGANIASILVRVNVPFSVAAGLLFLNEPLDWQTAAGVLLIICGITLTGLSPRMFRNPDGRFTKIPAKAFILGFGCGAAIGISPIFVKLGIGHSNAPIAGMFISYLAATVWIGFSLMNRKKRRALAKIQGRTMGLFFLTGLFSLAANLARYSALNLAPASVVAPLVWTFPVMLLFFSFIFNRNLEIFNRTVTIGTITVVAGSILLI